MEWNGPGEEVESQVDGGAAVVECAAVHYYLEVYCAEEQ